METDADLTPQARVVKASYRQNVLDEMRDRLLKFAPRSLEILEELAEGAENERVRLAAVESVLDRAGLGKTQTHQVTVDAQEHELVGKEAEEMMKRIQENQSARIVDIPLDSLIVHEGEIIE